LTVPDELVKLLVDGASPSRFGTMLLPLSKTSIAALFVIQFIYGWNQCWPLLVTTNEHVPVCLASAPDCGRAYTEWNVVMATAILAMLPPCAGSDRVQKWFVKGLVDTRKCFCNLNQSK
jgi:sn-glycerol 3-phosphate transport system permease protein